METLLLALLGQPDRFLTNSLPRKGMETFKSLRKLIFFTYLTNSLPRKGMETLAMATAIAKPSKTWQAHFPARGWKRLGLPTLSAFPSSLDKLTSPRGDGNLGFSWTNLRSISLLDKLTSPRGDGNKIRLPPYRFLAIKLDKPTSPRGDGNGGCTSTSSSSNPWQTYFPARGWKLKIHRLNRIRILCFR